MSKKRPISPHLTIYKPQITSVLSITHRLSGVALFFGAWLFAIWIVMNVYGCGSCINPFLSSEAGQAILVLWSMALFFHLLNGIRHLCWDIGAGYQLKSLTLSGWAVVIGTIVLTIVSWMLPVLI